MKFYSNISTNLDSLNKKRKLSKIPARDDLEGVARNQETYRKTLEVYHLKIALS